MVAQKHLHLSFMLTWTFVFFIPSICSGMEEPSKSTKLYFVCQTLCGSDTLWVGYATLACSQKRFFLHLLLWSHREQLIILIKNVLFFHLNLVFFHCKCKKNVSVSPYNHSVQIICLIT